VDLAVDKKLENPVSLHIIKQDSILQDMALVKQSRLSVMPVTTDQFHRVLLLSNTEY
jgi:predicted RNA-binding protein with PUA-like domain